MLIHSYQVWLSTTSAAIKLYRLATNAFMIYVTIYEPYWRLLITAQTHLRLCPDIAQHNDVISVQLLDKTEYSLSSNKRDHYALLWFSTLTLGYKLLTFWTLDILLNGFWDENWNLLSVLDQPKFDVSADLQQLVIWCIPHHCTSLKHWQPLLILELPISNRP